MNAEVLDDERVRYPLFAIHRTAELWQRSHLSHGERLSGFLSGHGYHAKLRLYDSALQRWHLTDIAPARPLPWWRRLLGRTIFDPVVSLSFRLAPPEPYALEALRAEVLGQVDLDDDSLTQYAEPEEWKAQLEGVTSFSELAARFEQLTRAA